MAALVAFRALVLAAAAAAAAALLDAPAGAAEAAAPGGAGEPFHRAVFPDDFIFGAASSAYQYEGAYNEDGKGPSIWDIYTHSEEGKGKIADGSNGDVALDSYHRYKEDVALAKDMGLDSYRFSISWSRILPKGSLDGGVNDAGVRYYHNLIAEVLGKGMQPFVTLFHWDSPQELEDRYGGFLSDKIIKDYGDYAEFCFKEFGDRVRFWITFNEPNMFASGGFGSGNYAPGRCTPPRCAAGDSATEPYLVGHNLLLSHAAAVRIYRDKYQGHQKGKIGITLTSFWYVPLTHSKSDRDAAERALDFNLGWFMDPVTHGDYPFIMRALMGDRLPPFTDEQSDLLRGSYDFVGINYYTANYATSSKNSTETSYRSDSWTSNTGVRDGVPIGPVPGSGWLYIYAEGFRELLLYVKHKYGSPVIYITENGVNELTNDDLSTEQGLKDPTRIYYHHLHLKSLQRAIKEGADVRGYFAWTLLDDFEWNSGYTLRFGLHYVDFKDGLKRYPKQSALWFKDFLKKSPHH